VDKEEMLRRLDDGEDPLEVSIQKWEDIVNGTGHDLHASNCALCHTHPSCIGCPIKELTGQEECEGTPYYKYHTAYGFTDKQEAAKEELEFLKSLRPKPKIFDYDLGDASIHFDGVDVYIKIHGYAMILAHYNKQGDFVVPSSRMATIESLRQHIESKLGL